MSARASVLAGLVLAAILQAPHAAQAASGCPYLAGSLGTAAVNIIDTPSSGTWSPPGFSQPSSCNATAYAAIAQELVALAQSDPSYTLPRLFALGFQSCATWSASGLDAGCSGGWLQWPADYEHPANAGLQPLVLAVQGVKQSWPCITFADLVTLGSAVAVEAAGGPPIAWYPGRVDALGAGPTVPPYSARLPVGDFSSAALLYYFTNLGLTVREATALMGGGHSLGGANISTSGYSGVYTPSVDRWPSPANRWFVDLVTYGWQCEEVAESQKVQYTLIPGQAGATYSAPDGTEIIRLPSDIAFRTSQVFSYWAVSYALKADAFVKDFQRALQRVLQLGAGVSWTVDTSYQWAGLAGTYRGYGPSIQPQLDTQDLPLAGAAEELSSVLGVIADPSAPYPTAS